MRLMKIILALLCMNVLSVRADTLGDVATAAKQLKQNRALKLGKAPDQMVVLVGTIKKKPVDMKSAELLVKMASGWQSGYKGKDKKIVDQLAKLKQSTARVWEDAKKRLRTIDPIAGANYDIKNANAEIKRLTDETKKIDGQIKTAKGAQKTNLQKMRKAKQAELAQQNRLLAQANSALAKAKKPTPKAPVIAGPLPVVPVSPTPAVTPVERPVAPTPAPQPAPEPAAKATAIPVEAPVVAPAPTPSGAPVPVPPPPPPGFGRVLPVTPTPAPQPVPAPAPMPSAVPVAAPVVAPTPSGAAPVPPPPPPPLPPSFAQRTVPLPVPAPVPAPPPPPLPAGFGGASVSPTLSGAPSFAEQLKQKVETGGGLKPVKPAAKLPVSSQSAFLAELDKPVTEEEAEKIVKAYDAKRFAEYDRKTSLEAVINFLKTGHLVGQLEPTQKMTIRKALEFLEQPAGPARPVVAPAKPSLEVLAQAIKKVRTSKASEEAKIVLALLREKDEPFLKNWENLSAERERKAIIPIAQKWLDEWARLSAEQKSAITKVAIADVKTFTEILAEKFKGAHGEPEEETWED